MMRTNSIYNAGRLFCGLMAAVAVLGSAPAALAGEPQWAAMSGIVDFGVGEIFGTQGVADPSNRPPARQSAVLWSDASGALWLFGGKGSNNRGSIILRNDLWKYDPATDLWTWMKGADTFNQSGTYGTQGVEAPENTPGARYGAASWTDASGALWLFGGWGHGSTGNADYLNDCWKYDPVTGNWTWMGGADTGAKFGIYGTQGVADPANSPGGRRDAIVWTDTSGTFWFFGGWGNDSTRKTGSLNDLWKYDPASSEWTWIKGSMYIDQSGTYGVPGEDNPLNTPGARYYSASWTDASGTFWLFGGRGFDSKANSGVLNDLWKYNPVTGNWTWIKGSDVAGQSGNYGTLGMADPNNIPGARTKAVSWVDAAGNFWLFSGGGNDQEGNQGFLNDLWKFNPETGDWTWIAGSNLCNQVGIYGTQGVAAPGTIPGARSETAACTDASGTLWLFGGEGVDAGNGRGFLGDLWKYEPATGYWTWIKGSSTINQAGSYGTQGLADPKNLPGGRWGSVSWTESSGNLWLFGGAGYDRAGMYDTLNDLWSYEVATGLWTWMKGSDLRQQLGIYGTQGMAAPDNTPGARFNPVSWTDPQGNFWLFGGYNNEAGLGVGYNDLWKYDPATNNWTWMKGANTPNQFGVYGTQGVAAPENTPGARNGAVSWVDPSGKLWLFGGMESFLPGSFSFLNDLWKYDPATNNWTWMKGADFPNQYGIYGTQGLAAPDNTPGARSNAVSWTDASGNLWLFSGYGRTRENTFAGYYNDLWKYEPASGHWTWIKGADFTNQPATYGIKGVEAPENAPGARNTAVSWTDLSGNLWLFGGRGMGANANSFGYLNDLWKYNPATGGWTWIKGADTSYQPGICKHYGVADSDNTPGARVLPVSWTDTQGALWLFGGSGYDCGGYQAYLGDLWRLTLDEVTSPTPTSTPSPTETPTPPPTATPTDTPTTPTPTATPTPTLAPTDTPLPTDTPTPQPTPTPVSFGFENSEEGWSFVSAAEFDAPIFRHVPGIDPGDTESTGVIMLVARNNTSTFGYWESPVFDLSGDEIIPAGVIPFEGPTGPDSLYTAHYRVGTSTADPGRVPQLRLRTTASNLQQSTLLMVDSRHDGAFSPTPEGREYILPFTPAPGATRFLLSFDLLNFNPADDPNGDLLLYSVQVARRDVGLLGEPTTHRSYTFNEDAEGWVQCATAAFTPPIFAAEPGALTLRGVAGDTNVFGYWGSPEADILIDPSRLYIVTFEVESDVAPEDRARVPQFRCRVNEKSYHAAMYVVVESRGDAARSPVAGQPQYYTVYFLPPAAAAGEGLILSLDFLNFDAVDIPDATLKLRSATVRSVPNPFAGN